MQNKKSPRLCWIKKAKDFSQVKANNVAAHGKSFIILCQTDAEITTLPEHGISDKIYAGVIASKKLSKKAADRNRAKRRLRSLANDILADDMPSGRYILIAKRPILDKKYDELCLEMRHLCELFRKGKIKNRTRRK